MKRVIVPLPLLLTFLLLSPSNGEYIASSPTPFTLRPQTDEKNITIVESVKSIDLSNEINYGYSSSSLGQEDSTQPALPATAESLVLARHKVMYQEVDRDARLANEILKPSEDSYIEAYRQSHAAAVVSSLDNSAEPTVAHPTYYEPQYSPTKDMKPPATSRISYHYPPPTAMYHHEPYDHQYSYKPSYSSYEPPKPSYGVVPQTPQHHQPVGGYVATTFGHQQVTYGAPNVAPAPPPVHHHQVTYVAPTQPVHHQVTYVAPTPQVHHMDYDYEDRHESYGVPYQAPGIFDKLKMKLNWYLIGKLLLKLILFKKFVKFMAILCLLFIIPKFKKGKTNDDDDEDRSRMYTVMSEDAQSALMQIFIGAMKTYSTNSSNHHYSNLIGISKNSKASKMLDKIDEKYSFTGIWDIYKDQTGSEDY